ncbi:hypothetical protein B0G57_10650 [Trinickia symbiotica]|uniref:Secreted protein n=1 Tax=Trinickia symbiotica TaxID=863227 RepID=A0A2N7WZN1_9BURK|nr:hypothetical protein [Trinickia symbiotica]PMS34837.1 hypothetical protein C0Z20_20775 [Trinickia symbiotica]PPK45053.1 hypothetical protein B0G57_10650 [Trinickia symbiotica]
MKTLLVTAVLAATAVASAPAWSYVNEQSVQQNRTGTDECAANSRHAAAQAEPTSKPPRLTVGTSYPDTKLNLPWFLTDIVNAVNTRQSPRCLLHTLGRGF